MALKSGREGVASSEVDRLGHISLPVASSSAVGGVKPVTKTSGMTQDVGVDSNGKLYTTPGSVYNLPVATSEVLGGVKPSAKTESMTQEVGVDENGVLYVAPGGGDVYYKDYDLSVNDHYASSSSVDVTGYVPISVRVLDVYSGYAIVAGLVINRSGNNQTIVFGYAWSGSAYKARVYYVKSDSVKAIPT